MKRTQICEILGVNKATVSLVLSGKKNFPIAVKIKYLSQFEDSFEAIIRNEAFQELCELVIKRALPRKESKQVELAINGKNLRSFLMNNFDVNDLQNSVLIMFDKNSFLDRKMQEFIKSPEIESMCDIAMRSTRKYAVRQLANTLKLIHQEFWKPKLNSEDEVSKV